MAYKTEELKVKALDVAKRYQCIFIEEIADAMNISKATFYEHKLNELNELKIIIDNNRFAIKNGLRKRWYDTPNPTTDIALYKLLSSKEELHQLSTNRNDNTNTNINLNQEMTEEQMNDVLDKLKRMTE